MRNSLYPAQNLLLLRDKLHHHHLPVQYRYLQRITEITVWCLCLFHCCSQVIDIDILRHLGKGMREEREEAGREGRQQFNISASVRVESSVG